MIWKKSTETIPFHVADIHVQKVHLFTSVEWVLMANKFHCSIHLSHHFTQPTISSLVGEEVDAMIGKSVAGMPCLLSPSENESVFSRSLYGTHLFQAENTGEHLVVVEALSPQNDMLAVSFPYQCLRTRIPQTSENA